MNTNDEKIQWHPAFDAALQIEFGDEAKYLEFDPEHLISKKPMQIDVLVKNEKHVKLRKNIGRIFRQYNIIEYKSPEDGSGTGRQRHILPHRDAIPIQLVIVQKLSKEHNYWLNNLRNDLKAGSEIKNFIESYSKNKNSKLYQALADAVMRANWEKLKEGSNMCEALKELFADDLRESREQGIIEGRIEGRNAGRIEGRIEGRCDITCNSYSCA